MRARADQYIAQSINSSRQVFVWLIFALGAVFVLGLIVSAPLALANKHQLVALTIYSSFSRVCHQLPERSFFIAGHPFAVCARCTGLYGGFAAALLIYPLTTSLRETFAPARKWLLLAALPMAIDFGLRFFGIWENTHTSRFLTGALLGAVTVFYVMPGVVDLALRGWRSESIEQRPAPSSLTKTVSPALSAAPSDYSAPHRRI